MASYSPFTVSSAEASELVRQQRNLSQDNRQCYLVQVLMRTVYGDGILPLSCYKKLPRLLNGIPLGAGRLSQGQAQSIQWRYVEGCSGMQTFLSVPISRDDAEEARRLLRDQLLRQAKAVFGDITVRCTVILSQAIVFEGDLVLNDIAEPMQEGLLFLD